MIYLSAALVFIAILFSYKPPTFIFRKIMVVEPPEHSAIAEIKPKGESMEDIMKDRPPTLDDVMRSLNETLYDLEGGARDNE